MRKAQLDSVFITSPHASHYAQVKAPLERDLHVLVGKPLTITPAKAWALIELARNRERFLQVRYQRNCPFPQVYARELFAKGALGEIRSLVAFVTQNWKGVRGWRLVPELSGRGMFFDTGSHLVASTLWVTGLQAERVSAFIDNEGKAVDIKAVVNVRFKDGAPGTLNTFGSASRHDERLAIHGSKGCLVFHLHQWQVKTVLPNDQPLEVPPRIKKDDPDAALFRWIRNGGKGYAEPWYALEVARFSDAAYRSARQGKPVKVAR
ncbi:MAG: Gfo/Idh/MocA family oxidoreductase [Candidatus Handelsmanbacteria bacterium]|nr:Gfo/Idh/MocA family oxidoreductase [Candidatus Handelsmanbacteria bacterium]